jgi:hypothetical protein
MTPSQAGRRKGKGRKGGKGSRQDDVLLIFFAAFIALLIATLTYSVLAGADANVARGRAVTSELIDGVPFALAVMMLFHGVTRLMEDSRVSRVAVWTARATTVVVAPAIGFFYLVSGTQDTVDARASLTAAKCLQVPPPPPAPGPLLSVILPIVLIGVLIPKLQPRPLRQLARQLRAVAPITVLAVSVVVAFGSAYVSIATPVFLLSPTAIQLYVVGTFGLFALLGIVLAFGYADSTRPPSTSTIGGG